MAGYGTVSRFQGGSRRTTYECQCCGRQTRETGYGESGCDLCAYCFEAGGFENEHSDGHTTDEEFNARIDALDKQFGKLAHAGCVR